MEPSPTSPSKMRTSDRHLWQIRWVRDLLIIAVVFVVLDVGYHARAITVPALMGLALAYAFNPLITWVHRRARVPRPVTAGIILIILLGAITALLAYLGPLLVDQIARLFSKFDIYVASASQHIGHWIEELQRRAQEMTGGVAHTQPASSLSDAFEVAATQATQPATQPMVTTRPATLSFQWPQIMGVLSKSLNLGISLVISTVGLMTYLLVAVVLVLFSFFMLSWQFEGVVQWFKQFIPASNRERTLDILTKMDRSVSGFIRGRLIQSLILGTVLTVGWAIAGVPFWLLLGIIAMALNLIPYAAVVTWPTAILLTWVDRISGGQSFSIWLVVIWPTVVYVAAQSLDGWVIEPLVQGKATNLHPLSILLAVLIGGTLGGIFGMMLAIPTAACIKILMQEIVVPSVKSWATAH